MREMPFSCTFYSPTISLSLLNGNSHIHQFISYNRAKDMVANCSECQDTGRGPANRRNKDMNSRSPSQISKSYLAESVLSPLRLKCFIKDIIEITQQRCSAGMVICWKGSISQLEPQSNSFLCAFCFLSS